MYGQTEATDRIAYVPPEELEARITSIGKPIANGELSLDPDTGELLYKGPNVFGGYAKSQDDLSTWDGSDILRTGDLATRDADGFYYIKGRLKRFVKIFGNRVNLDEVEDFIKGMENTGILACMGVEDQFILVAHANKELNASKLKLELFNRFKIHQNSIKCWHLPELPLTSNGKPDYKRIVSAYMSANS